MAVIEMTNIIKKFGEKVVIGQFSLKIEKKGLYAITGRSGCGKSTLLNIMGGIEKASEGDVTIFGHENLSLHSRKLRLLLRYNISYLFQNYALSDNDTVQYNLEMALRYHHHVKDREQAISDSLEAVGLAGYERHRVFTLSGGEQQRVAIARILLKPTELILADEPTGNLDAANRDAILKLLRRLHGKGKTLVIATHDVALAKMCDHSVNLDA